MALYPQIAEKIEKAVLDTGKKVRAPLRVPSERFCFVCCGQSPQWFHAPTCTALYRHGCEIGSHLRL